MTLLVVVTLISFLSVFVGLAFGIALGLRAAEPGHHSAKLHEGNWCRAQVFSDMVMWRRTDKAPNDCDAGHQAYVCSLTGATDHVDACHCGATREGVYGAWS